MHERHHLEEQPKFDGDGATPQRETEIAVSREAKSLNPAAIGAMFALAAVLLFLFLNENRTANAQALATKSATTGFASSAPPPLDMSALNDPGNGQGPFSNIPAQVGMPTPIEKDAAQFAESGSISAQSQSGSPALIVDLGAPPAGLAQLDPRSEGGDSDAAGPRVSALNESEQFARRVSGESPERAYATTLRNMSDTAPQGTIIPGVLETAINSDLPGYTRAVVSRDVMSFDGRKVLVPRSSRLIGEYKSAGAIGQTRVFVIWTRIIRPDGATIQIASAGTDQLGRGGLVGDVDRHFFQRFGGSILLSVLNAGVNAASSEPSTQITIGSPAAAAGIVGNIVQGEKISPTIKVRQGEAIRIFVARDLDFSRVSDGT